MVSTPEGLRRAIHWCLAAANQAERVSRTVSNFREVMFPPPGFRRVTPEDERPKVLFWADVHFLMAAVHHLRRALRALPQGPAFPEPLGGQVEELRHLLEHWWEAKDASRGSWKRLVEKHGEYATPTEVLFDLSDLKIGPDRVSVAKLQVVLGGIQADLARMEAAT